MTDEERQKLCNMLRTCTAPANDPYWLLREAADEIERLASELKLEECESEHYVRLAFIDAGANPAMTWKQEAERLAALAQSDAEPAWKPDANMCAELDRSEMIARAMLKEIMKQTDYIEAEGHIEWHKRIHVNGELYLPDISAAVLASLYTAAERSGK